ncbi:MAG: response regulator [Eubacteriales bacterium]|jgi:two-component system response regulator YesN
MLKVFLVEDEYIIREAIRKTVNWEKEGFILVGEAGDGERAYPMILETQPDILVTDIRMPFMDGLQLSKLVRENLPSVKIIILSGFDDFSYAKEAISIGVNEYLLKPVSGAKLVETLNKVGKTIAEEKEQLAYRDIYEAEHEERMKLERGNFLKSVISGRLSMPEILEKSNELEINMTAPYYQIVLFQMIRRDEFSKSVRSGAEPGDMIADTLNRDLSVLCYEQVGGSWCALLTGNSDEQIRQKEEDIIARIRNCMSGEKEYMYFTAVGPVVGRVSEIRDSFHRAGELFARRFLYEDSHEFTFDNAEEHAGGKDGGAAEGEDFSERREVRSAAQTEAEGGQKSATGGAPASGNSIRMLDEDAAEFWKMDRSYLLSFLERGAAEDVDSFVRAMVENVGKQSMSSLLFRQYIMMDVYLTVTSYLQNCGYSMEEIEKACGRYDEVDIAKRTTDEVEQYLRKNLSAALTLRDRLSENQSTSYTEEAQKYVRKHYMENELSLSSVASAIGVSASHLSRIFSQKTGHTFVEYLTDVRMEHAKELMRTTNLTSAEIGLKVGYSDPHYFYYIFKKTQNMTPKEFRSSTEE